MEIIWFILISLLAAILIWGALIFILVLYNQIKSGDAPDLKNKTNMLLLIISVLLAFSYTTMKDYWGSDTIDSFFSKSEFDTQYYVQLFPEGSESKNYLVPAELHVDGDNIYIHRVHWPNGGYTTFYDYGDMDPQEFYLNKHINYQDDEGREWTIILTDQKVK